MMLRTFINGLILNIQFFSIIPLGRKEVPITTENIRRAIQLFPILGLFQGISLIVLLYVFVKWTVFSPLAIAFMLWIMLIVITGGIHLDGWIDSSDAFFSYQDQKRRVEILADPTIGAFGLISAIILLAVRFLFIYETVQMIHSVTFFVILLIPFFGKMFMGIILTTVRPVKRSGIGHLFHEASDRKIFLFYAIYVIIIISSLTLLIIDVLMIALMMLFITLIVYIFAKRKVKQWFGGITGDVVGGATEGVETILWLTIWLYHYYAMGLH